MIKKIFQVSLIPALLVLAVAFAAIAQAPQGAQAPAKKSVQEPVKTAPAPKGPRP